VLVLRFPFLSTPRPDRQPMSHRHDDDTPSEAADLVGQPDSAVLHQVAKDVRSILERLARGDTALALLEHRVKQLETIVFGLVSTILLAFIGGVVLLVMKTGGA
jgi:hypothetical protein